jgi:hypothetical protein
VMEQLSMHRVCKMQLCRLAFNKQLQGKKSDRQAGGNVNPWTDVVITDEVPSDRNIHSGSSSAASSSSSSMMPTSQAKARFSSVWWDLGNEDMGEGKNAPAPSLLPRLVRMVLDKASRTGGRGAEASSVPMKRFEWASQDPIHPLLCAWAYMQHAGLAEEPSVGAPVDAASSLSLQPPQPPSPSCLQECRLVIRALNLETAHPGYASWLKSLAAMIRLPRSRCPPGVGPTRVGPTLQPPTLEFTQKYATFAQSLALPKSTASTRTTTAPKKTTGSASSSRRCHKRKPASSRHSSRSSSSRRSSSKTKRRQVNKSLEDSDDEDDEQDQEIMEEEEHHGSGRNSNSNFASNDRGPSTTMIHHHGANGASSHGSSSMGSPGGNDDHDYDMERYMTRHHLPPNFLQGALLAGPPNEPSMMTTATPTYPVLYAGMTPADYQRGLQIHSHAEPAPSAEAEPFSMAAYREPHQQLPQPHVPQRREDHEEWCGMGQALCQRTRARASEISLRQGPMRFVSCRNDACVVAMKASVIQAIVQQQREDNDARFQYPPQPYPQPHMHPQPTQQPQPMLSYVQQPMEPATRPLTRQRIDSNSVSATSTFLHHHAPGAGHGGAAGAHLFHPSPRATFESPVSSSLLLTAPGSGSSSTSGGFLRATSNSLANHNPMALFGSHPATTATSLAGGSPRPLLPLPYDSSSFSSSSFVGPGSAPPSPFSNSIAFIVDPSSSLTSSLS